MADRRSMWLSVLLIALATVAAYATTLHCPFVFDDIPSILDNASIRQLWPLSGPLSPPREHGITVSGRPLLNLTLAVNYAVSGTDPWSYHLLNLLIHLGAALALFGALRRLYAQPGLPIRLQEAAVPAACVTALLWAVHPLHTESVTYVIQRAESLMGLCYFLTIYAFVRRVTGGGPAWSGLSVAACLAGVATKEVAVTAPLMVLTLDRAFFSASWAAAIRRRPAYYTGLLLTWVPLALFVLDAGGNRGGTYRWTPGAFVGFWLTQPEALTRYLGLAVWPHPLIFDYGMKTHDGALAVAGYSAVLAIFVGTTIGLWRRHKPAAVGLALVPLVLAPTSLLPSLMQVIVEHRMYVPLAGLLAAAVGALVAWKGKPVLLAGLALAFVAAVATMLRNQVYQDPFLLWADTLSKRPTSAKAHNNLGHALHRSGELDEAIMHYEAALRLDPSAPNVHFNLGLALQTIGRPAEAMTHYREAVRILPKFPQAQAQIGVLLASSGQRAEAAEQLDAAYAANPKLPAIHLGRGMLLSADGHQPEAIAAFARALELAPGLTDAQLGWGVALQRQGRLQEAADLFRQLTISTPGLPEAHANLGVVLAQGGEPQAALASLQEALRLRPEFPNARYNLGNVYFQLERWAEAREQYELALRAQPDFPAAQEKLARLRAAGVQ